MKFSNKKLKKENFHVLLRFRYFYVLTLKIYTFTLVFSKINKNKYPGKNSALLPNSSNNSKYILIFTILSCE